jgi:hypothetical protein
MPKLSRRNRLIWIGVGALLTCIVLVAAFIVAYDLPGGIADHQMSHAIGVKGTLHIPLGKTPDEAIKKFRHFPSMQVIHREPVKGGILLFLKRYYQQDGTDLQVEYVRKTWLGWKWVTGGGFGTGGTMLSNSGLDYMGMPKIEGIQTPFPIEYGDVLDPSVKHVIIVVNGKSPGIYAGRLAGSETGHTIWFTFLPPYVSTPFEIEGLNAKGDIVIRKTINDLRESGRIDH